MAGSEELGLREDTLRVLAAFLRRGETAGSPVATSPSPAPEEPTDFLSRLRRCLPCSLGRGAAPPESPRPCSLPIRPCYGSEPGPATPDFYALVAQRLEQLVEEQLKSPSSPAGLGPRPAQQAGPPVLRLFHSPGGAVLQPGGPISPKPSMPWAPASFSGAPGPPGPGHGAEPARGRAGGHPGRTQRGARAQLHALDPGPGGLGGHPGCFTCGLELAIGLSSASEAATRLHLMSLPSACAFPSLPVPLRTVGWWLPFLFLPKINCLKLFVLKALQIFNCLFFHLRTEVLAGRSGSSL
ncbi:bcl-2-like protein 12 isoform X3 [Callithrix jacchus]